MEKKIGIYCIENIINGKKYIGQSINLKDRLYGHKTKLKHNKHKNRHLQFAVNKYGISRSHVTSCANGHLKHAGKHPITGEPLSWIKVESKNC